MKTRNKTTNPGLYTYVSTGSTKGVIYARNLSSTNCWAWTFCKSI